MIIVALSGVARSGKDTFCDLLIHRLKLHDKTAKRFALADRLKSDLYFFIKSNFNIDIFTANEDDRKLLRPSLVEYGRAKRIQTNGEYWTKLLERDINQSTVDVAIITDIRYDVYPQDEVYWAKDHLGGTLVHISRYNLSANGEKIFVSPPNSDEAENDPKIKAKADYLVEWPTYKSVEDCIPFVDGFIKQHIP